MAHLGSQYRKAKLEALDIVMDLRGITDPSAGLKRARYNKAVRFLRSQGELAWPIKWIVGFDGEGWYIGSIYEEFPLKTFKRKIKLRSPSMVRLLP